MNDRTKIRLGMIGLLALLLAGNAPSASAAEGDAATDTVRTNLWLIEALMRDVVATSTVELPPPPAGVLVAALGSGDDNDLMAQIIAEELTRANYTVYFADGFAPGDTSGTEASLPEGRAAYEMRFRVMDTELAYPETGRRLGIWREWVARNIQLTVTVSILEIANGRMLFSDRISRNYRDRVPAQILEDVESNLYDFTAAETQESGWQNRLEEVVVLGTLAGLVAVYFANTR